VACHLFHPTPVWSDGGGEFNGRNFCFPQVGMGSDGSRNIHPGREPPTFTGLERAGLKLRHERRFFPVTPCIWRTLIRFGLLQQKTRPLADKVLSAVRKACYSFIRCSLLLHTFFVNTLNSVDFANKKTAVCRFFVLSSRNCQAVSDLVLGL